MKMNKIIHCESCIKNEKSFFLFLICLSFLYFSLFGILTIFDISDERFHSFFYLIYGFYWFFISTFVPISAGFVQSIRPWRWAISIWISLHIWIICGIAVGILQEEYTGVAHLSQIGLLPIFTIPYLGFLILMAYLGAFIRKKRIKKSESKREKV